MKAEYLDHLGTDLTVVDAARVSFDKKSSWAEDGSLQEKDVKLLSYLARNGHWTPFAHPQITIRETVPIFVARQRFKHVIGFVYNEVSRRYVDDNPEFYYPSNWRGKPRHSKQGSSDVVMVESYVSIPGTDVTLNYAALVQLCAKWYQLNTEAHVAPEQARMVLPQSMYTSYHVTGSLMAWARFYNLRSDPHAQLEIQELAQQVGEIIQPLFPHSWRLLTTGTLTVNA